MDGFFDYIYSLRNYYIYGTLVISIPSFLLYLSEVLVIIKNKKLHNSFNKLFVIRAITDFFKLWSQLLGNRLPKIIGGFLLPFYQLLPDRILALYIFFLFFCFYADNLAAAAIQFNRFTAIAFPMHYEKIWRYLLPLSILIIYGISLYLSFCFFSMGIQLSIVNNDPLSGNRTSFSIIEVGTHNLDSNSLVATFSIIFLIGCTALNLLTIFLYKWRNRRQSPASKNNQNSQISQNSNVVDPIEKKLLIYAMTIFVAQAIITVYFISYGFPFIPMNFLLTFGPMVVEIGTIILPSWLMLWASFDFRKQWAKDVLPKRWNLWKNDERKTTNNINISRKLPSQLNGNGLRMPQQSSQNNNVSPINRIARIK